MADGKKHKENVDHFCRVEQLSDLLEGLPPKRINTVHDMGAGFVFNLRTKKKLRLSITNYLVRCRWDMNGVEIKEGVHINIRSLIKDLIDMPSGGKKLNHPGNHDYEDLEFVKNSRFSYLVGYTIGKLWDKVKDIDLSDADFRVLFMLALLNTLLAPSRYTKVDTSFLPDLMDDEKIKELDWCAFIVDYLIKGIQSYKEVGSVPGCLLVLHLAYADYVKRWDIKPPPDGLPRSDHIGDAYLDRVAKQVVSMKKRKSGDSDHVESMDSSPHSVHQSFRNEKAPAGYLRTVKRFRHDEKITKAIISLTCKLQNTAMHYLGEGVSEGKDEDVPMAGESFSEYTMEEGAVPSSGADGESGLVPSSALAGEHTLTASARAHEVEVDGDQVQRNLVAGQGSVTSPVGAPENSLPPVVSSFVASPVALAGTHEVELNAEVADEEEEHNDPSGTHLLEDNRDQVLSEEDEDNGRQGSAEVEDKEQEAPPEDAGHNMDQGNTRSSLGCQNGKEKIEDRKYSTGDEHRSNSSTTVQNFISDHLYSTDIPGEGSSVVSPPLGHASSMEEEEEEVGPVHATPRQAPGQTLPVKGGSTFNILQSASRIRADNKSSGYYYAAQKIKKSWLLKYQEVYNKHVLQGETNGNPKVTIEGASVTAEEFVNSLKEEGEATEEFANVCVTTMKIDWEKRKKSASFIIDVPTMVKIRDGTFTEELIDQYFRNAVKLKVLERVYIMLKNNNLWFLCIMFLRKTTAQIFCPSLNGLERTHEYEEVLNNVVDKLQRSLYRLQLAYPSPLQFEFTETTRFHMVFPDESKVDIKNAGAFIYLLNLIEEHTGKEISDCRLTHAQLLNQKKRLAYVLVDHAWNTLHPKRLKPVEG